MTFSHEVSRKNMKKSRHPRTAPGGPPSTSPARLVHLRGSGVARVAPGFWTTNMGTKVAHWNTNMWIDGDWWITLLLFNTPILRFIFVWRTLQLSPKMFDNPLLRHGLCFGCLILSNSKGQLENRQRFNGWWVVMDSGCSWAYITIL